MPQKKQGLFATQSWKMLKIYHEIQNKMGLWTTIRLVSIAASKTYLVCFRMFFYNVEIRNLWYAEGSGCSQQWIHDFGWKIMGLPMAASHFWLVVSTPLKNDGVRQLGWWNSQYMGKWNSCSKPPTSRYSYHHIKPSYWSPNTNGSHDIFITSFTSHWYSLIISI